MTQTLPILESDHTLTEEQQAIIDFFLYQEGNLQIEARAGTGKTTMLKLLGSCLSPSQQDSTIALVFNKRMADELRDKMDCSVMTLNGFGFKALRNFIRQRCEPKANRVSLIVSRICRDLDEPDAWSPIKSLAVMAKVHGLLPKSAPGFGKGLVPDTEEAWIELAEACQISPEGFEWSFLIDQARKVLAKSLRDAFQGQIDFDDQIYIPVCYRLQFDSPSLLLVDEAQDLNPIQIEMVRRARPKRFICVGDPHQAIYQFRGADRTAFETLGQTFDCHHLPLTVSFRCPQKIIRLAQDLVPDIKALPDAPEGEIHNLLHWNINDPRFGDTILCRTNYPLLKIAFSMLRHRLPFTYQGRDMAQGLKSLTKKISKACSYDLFQTQLEAWKTTEAEALISRGDDPEPVYDRASCLKFLAQEAKDFPELLQFIETIFGQNARGPLLSSIHRYKGFEADTVWFVDRHKAISRFAQEHGGWPLEQDTNCVYVGLTRARSRLIFVRLSQLEA